MTKPQTTQKIWYGIAGPKCKIPYPHTIRPTKGEAIASYTHRFPNGIFDFMQEGYHAVKLKIEVLK